MCLESAQIGPWSPLASWTCWALHRAPIHPVFTLLLQWLFSSKAWSTQFKISSKVCSRAWISENRKNLQNYILFLEKKWCWPQSTEINNLRCLLQGVVPARWGGPLQMPSQPLGSPLSRNELGGGISAALRSVARKVLSETAAANQEQAGMGYNGKENRLKINIKYTITNYKQPALSL